LAITKDMLISEIIREYPESIEILIKNGMGCIGCPASQMESLEEAAMVHGMDLEKLLEALNN
jgi:hybrid cluster-associated redox disulfide protein